MLNVEKNLYLILMEWLNLRVNKMAEIMIGPSFHFSYFEGFVGKEWFDPFCKIKFFYRCAETID